MEILIHLRKYVPVSGVVSFYPARKITDKNGAKNKFDECNEVRRNSLLVVLGRLFLTVSPVVVVFKTINNFRNLNVTL